MPRGGRVRNKELYNAVLAAYRAAGGNHTRAAKLSGVDRNTAKRLWHYGWTHIEGALPIKDQILKDQIMVRAARAGADPEEQASVAEQVLVTSLESAKEGAKDAAEMLARAAQKAEELHKQARATLDEAQAKLQEVEALTRAKMDETDKLAQVTLQNAEIEAKQRLADLLQKAKVDAAETMADEANAAKFGRKAALSAVAIAALVLKDASTIAAGLRTAIGDVSKLSPLQAMRLAREMVRLVEASEKSLILALQAERLRIGQPTDIVGIQSVDASLEEKEVQLKAVQRSIEKRKRMQLLQGGASNGDEATPVGAEGAAS